MPHNLAPGHPGPPPPHRPRVPAGAPSCRGYRAGPSRGAPCAPGRCNPGLSSGCASDPRPLPAPAAPTFPLAGRGCTRRAQGAGGAGRRQAERGGEHRPRRRARSSCSRGAPPSFPPGERGDGGGSRERKSRVPSATRRSSTARHEPSRRRRRQRRGGRWVNRRPEPWSWAAGWPRPSRRAGMRGRAPWRPITARRPPGPPRACLPGP